MCAVCCESSCLGVSHLLHYSGGSCRAELVLRDWAKGLRTVRRRVIMLASYYGRSHLVVRLLT